MSNLELEKKQAREVAMLAGEPGGYKNTSQNTKIPEFHAEIGSTDNTDLVICEMCGQTFETSDSNQDYCLQCRND